MAPPVVSVKGKFGLMWDAIQNVSTPLALVAFLAALVAWVLRMRLRGQEKTLRTLPDSDFAEAILTKEGAFGVETQNLTRQQQYELALKQIAAREGRFQTTARVFLLVALLLAGLAAYAMYPAANPAPEGSPHDGPTITNQDGPIQNTAGNRSPVAGGDQTVAEPGAVVTIGASADKLAEKWAEEARARGAAEFRVSQLEEENQRLREQAVAGITRVEERAEEGDTASQAAIAAARDTGDATQLLAVLQAEVHRQEAEILESKLALLELHREIAAIAYLTGDIAQAEQSLQTILRFFPNHVDATNRLGHIYRLRGDLVAADVQYRRLLELAPEHQEVRAVALGNLGIIARTRSDLDEAERLMNGALDIYKAMGSLEGQAMTLSNLGGSAYSRGDLDESERRYNASLEIDYEQGHREGQAYNLGSLGAVALTRGDLDEAERLMNEALDIYRSLGRVGGQAAQLADLGLLARTRGNLDEAELLINEALDIYRTLGSLEGLAHSLGHLGALAFTRGDVDKAEQLHNESLKIERRLGSLEGQAIDLGYLGVIALYRGDLDEAARLFHESLEIEQKLGRLGGQTASLTNLGTVAKERGDLRKAREHWTAARDLYRKIGMPHDVARVQGWLDALAEE